MAGLLDTTTPFHLRSEVWPAYRRPSRRVGAEMLAASDWVIFDAKEFLKADVMLASLAVIGLISERLVFGSLERATVLRWGMVREM